MLRMLVCFASMPSYTEWVCHPAQKENWSGLAGSYFPVSSKDRIFFDTNSVVWT